MKKIAILCFVVFVCSNVLAQTDVSGDVSGNWTLAGSPYNVIGDLTIQAVDALTIDAGVEVRFQDHYKFEVYGNLTANGSDSSNINFTAENISTGWGGLRFYNQNNSELSYCNFEYGKANQTDLSGGALYLENSDIQLNYIKIMNCEAQEYGGAIFIKDSEPMLKHLEIYNNQSIRDGGGIYCFNSQPTLENIALAYNSTQWNGGGIALFNDSDVSLIKITMYGNSANMDGEGLACLYNSNVNITSSIFWMNGYEEIYVQPSASCTATYSDILNGYTESYYSDGCISTDPLFVDPAANNFQLTAGSPCINAGNPDQNYNDPDFSRSDMGAFSYLLSGIKGKIIIDPAEDDDPQMSDVTVEISGDSIATTTPNEAGDYYFELEPGNYTVTASLEEYYPVPESIDVEVAEIGLSEVDNITMNHLHKGTIHGQVLINGNPIHSDIPDVTISVETISTSPYPVYEADVLVRYDYQVNILPGYWDVTATGSGYEDSTLTEVLVLQNVTNYNNDFDLNPVHAPGYVSGNVQLYAGSGNVQDVVISDGSRQTNPDANGDYTLQTLDGEREIIASLDGYASITRDAMVLPYATTTGVDFVLQNWEVNTDDQYNMIIFATVSHDGRFVKGEESNILGIFGAGGITDCRAIGTWIEGNHPYWCTDMHYYDLPGYWYLTPISDIQNGEILSFKVYDTETDNVLDCYESFTFINDTHNSVDLTTPSPTKQQEIELVSNWNWISMNLMPADNSTQAIFSSLTPDIYQVKWEGESAIYLDPNWVGSLTEIETNYGLKVNMDTEANFVHEGEAINSLPNTIYMHYDENLVYNYNWVSYYPNQNLSLPVALESLEDKVSDVKTMDKSAILDEGTWYGDLNQMEPGDGYLINVIDTTYINTTCLTYPNEEILEGKKKDIAEYNEFNPANWNKVTNNSTNMIVMAKTNKNYSKNHSIGVFDEAGNCRSIGKKEDGFCYFTVLGDAENELHFKLYDADSRKSYASEKTFTYKANEIIGNPKNPLPISFENYTASSPETTVATLSNHPNPFNPSTDISYSLPATTDVKLSVFNLKGQLVETLVNENQKAGNYSINWDATDYGSGVYFYRLDYGSKSIVKKCIMLK